MKLKNKIPFIILLFLTSSICTAESKEFCGFLKAITDETNRLEKIERGHRLSLTIFIPNIPHPPYYSAERQIGLSSKRKIEDGKVRPRL